MILSEFVDWYREEKAVLDSQLEPPGSYCWRYFTDEVLARLSRMDEDEYLITEEDSLTADLGDWIAKEDRGAPRSKS